MPNLLAMAQQHLEDHDMPRADARAMLEDFARGVGRDLPWTTVQTHMPSPWADRIDRAAVNWMMAHRMVEDAPEQEKHDD